MSVRNTQESGESNDLSFVERFLVERLDDYTFVVLQHRSPVNMGFPMLRPRFYVVGAHKCKIPKEIILKQLNDACTAVGAAEVMPDFLTFLNLRTQNLVGDGQVLGSLMWGHHFLALHGKF